MGVRHQRRWLTSIRRQAHMRSDSSLHKLLRPTAALAIAASVLGVAGAPASAEGPCGTPLFSGDTTRIGNQVFLDANDDGVFGAGETGLANVDVGLWLDVDGDGVFEPGADDGAPVCSTSTNAQGQYWFTDVASGSYFVAVTGGVPADHASSTATHADQVVDNNDNGAPAAGMLSVAGPLSLDSADDQPRNEAGPGLEAGADEATANTINGRTADGNSNLTFDFGFAPVVTTPTCASVGNRIWNDVDGNGYDDGEAGINGVTVDLFAADADGNPTGTALDSTVTTGGGYYQFSCVDPGTYVVVVPASNFADNGPLAGLESTADNADADTADLVDDGVNPAVAGGDVMSSPVALAPLTAPTGETDKPAVDGIDFDAPADDSSDTTVDFGFVETVVAPASVGDKVWMDTNDNGVQDDGEPGVANVMVNLLDADDNFLDSTKTDADGMYIFDELAPGTYGICFDVSTLPDGKIVTTINSGDNDAADSDAGEKGCTEAVTLAEGEANMTIDLGIVDEPVVVVEPTPTASVGDKVWIDANNNGIQDAGEAPVADVTVQLRHEDGTILDTTVTDADGMYSFDELEPGDYQVCFDMRTLPAGMIETDANQGGADDADSDADADGCTPMTTLDPGEDDTSIDLGIRVASTDLGIIKTGAVDGATQVWTITVTNLGPDRNPGGITITDTLPAGLTYELGTGGGFTCNAAGQIITCTRAADLDVDESAVLTVRTKTNSAAGCSVVNAVTVSSAATDTVVTNNSASSQLTVPCASPATLTQTPTPTSTPRSNLPVTGGSTGGPLLVGALLLAGTGWRLLTHVQRERPVSIEEMLG